MEHVSRSCVYSCRDLFWGALHSRDLRDLGKGRAGAQLQLQAGLGGRLPASTLRCARSSPRSLGGTPHPLGRTGPRTRGACRRRPASHASHALHADPASDVPLALPRPVFVHPTAG